MAEETMDDWLSGVVRNALHRAADKYRRAGKSQNRYTCAIGSGTLELEAFDADAMRFLLREAVAGDRLASDLFLEDLLNR